MNKILIIVTAIFVVIVIAFFVLGVMSKSGHAPGLKQGQLQACTSIENCVFSENIDGAENNIQPFAFDGEKAVFLTQLKTSVESMGGKIVDIEDGYIAATFTSAIFGFVDDLELRVSDDHLLHFRSASRVGKSDLGANKKRVEALKLLLQRASK
ncbi:DUF1499 domain-containing protein [Psychromonas arctica]|uniref:DUF1499 domain-containing protein n=1 Tax=Psychromonas arctica TaxID=168275 RepID=UPI0004004837|nr:DUF1499 domain-containing protein [Psychromonas arctica]